MENLQVVGNAKVYETIKNVMQKIDAISKNRKNQQQNFVYRGIDDVMNELHPILSECGLFIVPEVLNEDREERQTKSGSTLLYSRQKIKFTFYAVDGSSVSAVVIGEGMDSGDKASNKALSVAYKYACLQVFCIPTEDAKDPDGDSYTVTPTAPAKKTQEKLTKKEQHELEVVSNEIRQYIAKGLFSSEMVTKLSRYLEANNLNGLKDALTWVKAEEKCRAENTF